MRTTDTLELRSVVRDRRGHWGGIASNGVSGGSGATAPNGFEARVTEHVDRQGVVGDDRRNDDGRNRARQLREGLLFHNKHQA